MKNRLLMPMSLQLFAEGGESGAGDGAQGGSSTNSQQGQQSSGEGQQSTKSEGDQSPGKTFSRDDVAKMIAAETKKARASWDKELEAKQKEAEKLAKMNAEEKLKHQLEQKEAEINELKRGQTLVEMSKEASKMLTEAELPVNDDLLSLIVSEDAEKTSAAVKIITDFASQIKKANARQTPPNEGGQFSAGTEKEYSVAEMAKESRIIKN